MTYDAKVYLVVIVDISPFKNKDSKTYYFDQNGGKLM